MTPHPEGRTRLIENYISTALEPLVVVFNPDH
jgi:hypothetical protein